MNSNISGFENKEEQCLVENVIKFVKKTFNLFFDLDDFYNPSTYPFFTAKYCNKDNLLFIEFPVVNSFKEAEIRIKITNPSILKNLEYKDLFENIIFDYNNEFKKEVYNIHNLSVEDVFEIEYFNEVRSK
tara:strand:- start:943 stop:1332 length:390 start_codon:yes stop_codon:yes gene_type:complete